jgi:hypothetical protein
LRLVFGTEKSWKPNIPANRTRCSIKRSFCESAPSCNGRAIDQFAICYFRDATLELNGAPTRATLNLRPA